ncbi:hypothetical protein [uncultured Erythrobacter sp.]|uniref:hypothetical protein n=1 Tax=uncultured Erythrobacter sp. TaxID=263913 RepID=UPI002657CD9C|nr:hypothetical protein [uncultured Erythrobacter sp.]
MRRAFTLLAVIATVTGVACATPAFARSGPQSRNIPCEDPPPTADVVSTRQGGVNLQLPGFGLGADRSRGTSRTDVIINAEGTEGWFDLDLYAKACHAIVQTWPNDPIKQLEKMFEVRDRLRSSATPAATPEREFAISDAEAKELLWASFASTANAPPATAAPARANAPRPRPSSPSNIFDVSAKESDDQAVPAHIANSPLFNPMFEVAQQGKRSQPSSPPITFDVSAKESDDQAVPAHIANSPLFNPMFEVAQQGKRSQPSSPPITFNVSATRSDDQAMPVHIYNNPLFNPMFEVAQQGKRSRQQASAQRTSRP